MGYSRLSRRNPFKPVLYRIGFLIDGMLYVVADIPEEIAAGLEEWYTSEEDSIFELEAGLDDRIFIDRTKVGMLNISAQCDSEEDLDEDMDLN